MSQLDNMSGFGKPRRLQSAVLGGSGSRRALTRTLQLQQELGADEQTQRSIWRALGSYIAKQLINGKGVQVPKFGNFTYSATELDMAGTTNPQNRDKQIREPVFMVGKDFVSAVSLRTGVAHNNGQSIRPLELKGASGIIPQVKVNYVEVGLFCNQSKEICRNSCELIFRALSDKVRRGENVTHEIPLVGRLIIRNGIAAIAFNPDLIEQTRGNTAKQFVVGNLFSNANSALNLNIHVKNALEQNAKFGLGGAMKVTDNASVWLKDNLDINLNDLPDDDLLSTQAYSAPRVHSAKPPSGSRRLPQRTSSLHLLSASAGRNVPLSEAQLDAFDRASRISNHSRRANSMQRPQSAVTHTTAMASHMSQIPHVDRMQLMSIAREMFQARQAIFNHCSSGNCRFQLRDVISSSQMHTILKKCGVFVEIMHLKALLKELGFPFNGRSTSLTILLTSCKSFLHGYTSAFQGQTLRSSQSQSNFSGLSFTQSGRLSQGGSQTEGKKVIGMLRDLFYSTRRNLYEIFKIGMSGQALDYDGFWKLVSTVSDNLVPEQDAVIAFSALSKNKNGKVTFDTFEKAFRSEVPTTKEFETKVIRTVRDWMYQNKLSSEMAFDSLCRAAARYTERTLTRAQFHKAIQACEVGLTAAQVDALFTNLSGEALGEIDIKAWQTRIYEDADNPLQMIREIVFQSQLTQDDLLFQMKLRVWDKPLSLTAFMEAMRNLDQSISDAQIKALFNDIRGDDGKVDVPTLVRNFTGKAYETVDFRNKIFKKCYNEIYPNNEEKVLQLLQEQDVTNCGIISGASLLTVLQKVIKNVSKDDLDRFVRFLEKDKLGKLSYTDFLKRMQKSGNKNHNPFKTLINRLAFFLKQNNVTGAQLIKRLSASNSNYATEDHTGIAINTFAGFLKQKVEKKKEIDELKVYARMMDVDKDGFISDDDISTCIKNLNNAAFFRQGGEALTKSTFNTTSKFYPVKNRMSREKALEVCKQIREALARKKLQYREAFDLFDTNKDNMVSYAEFSRGIAEVIELSQPVMEQLYSVMDKNRIGLITYNQFLEVLRLEKIEKAVVEDNFDWEYGVIKMIRKWINKERITVDEAFKCFDRDFDGFVSKQDLKASLEEILEINTADIRPTKLDRLFSLLDFFKTGKIQVSDFQRLVSNENPYRTTFVEGPTQSIQRSLGGGLNDTSTFNWVFSAVQQVGLRMSKKYNSIQASFKAASNGKAKVSFDDFKSFVEKENSLHGFNLTVPLLQRLYSELDPHKKGYLNENDWKNAFATFNWNDQLLIELKHIIQSSFANCDSVYTFFTNFSTGKKSGSAGISFTNFEQAVNSLTAERFKKADIRNLWKKLCAEGAGSIDRHQFRSHFDHISYSGNSTVKTVSDYSSSRVTSASNSTKTGRTTIQSRTSSSSQWNDNILEKLRTIVKSSTKTLDQIFKEFDSDGNGFISEVEFRNAIRKLELGLTSRDIDQLMARIDTNNDGRISYAEFIAKFKDTSYEERLKGRAQARLAKLRELMILHMTSANDAFRFFDQDRSGNLCFTDFSNLVHKVHEMANEKAPTYPVIKDLFETLDIRKDGVVDLHEWQQTFGRVTQGNNKMSIKPTSLAMWENSRDFDKIGFLIAKNRKQLTEQFRKVLGEGALFTFEQGREALDAWLYSHFQNKVNDEQLECIFRAAQAHNSSQVCPKYDYIKLLDIYKARHSGPQL